MEIKRMKEDVRAAREKNGVYISHERFAKEEAEKKAKDERIEQIENDLSLSQKEKLEKTSNSLRDLQENYRMVVSTLKEKEYTISKLLKSGLFTFLIKSSGCVWFLLKDKALIQRVFLKMFTLLKLVTNLVELKSVNCLLLHLVKITTSFAEIQQKDLCFRAKFGESSLLEEIFSMLYCMAISNVRITTRSKAKSASNQWVMLPFSTK
ncbi:hypothetical protein S245_030415, partial [Arachis hypogaea]